MTKKKSQDEREQNRLNEKVQTGHVTGRNSQDEGEGKHKRKRLRQAMSPEETSKTRAKETDGKRRIRQVMSPEEKAKIREKETKKRKRLTIEKMMLIVSRRQRNIYTELKKILSILTSTSPLFASFVINLLLVQRQFTICKRTILVFMEEDFLWKLMKDIMIQSSNLK